jgi:hypothetical protein
MRLLRAEGSPGVFVFGWRGSGFPDTVSDEPLWLCGGSAVTHLRAHYQAHLQD